MNANREADERELKTLYTAFLNAILQHDLATLEQDLPDDFLSVFPNGHVANKAMELENAKTVELESFSTDELQVYWYGDSVAILNFRLSLTFKGQKTKQVRDSHVYLRRNGRWQMILGQTTPIL
ncbi:nuclear transport factor 2 family protein [Gloeocapsopsis crepidinum LEGE 06123]|uniref:Nuclear transport factor 2 family protein n=1 Tax=Gloeocapsopsis crepidinum LEGE 06123 TaxID=588587 RepID=A0ABR9URQ3_9CHRO|nr:nuclear transport factor 2 family protein [Gloeocapsopsis crepidinum]MBE9190962.1 nuclear transport factor 2 family protein [Gloeocapsopsis crepidinum LEGE 06123]